MVITYSVGSALSLVFLKLFCIIPLVNNQILHVVRQNQLSPFFCTEILVDDDFSTFNRTTAP